MDSGTHATLLLEGGASIKETQDRLGHKMLKLPLTLILMLLKKLNEMR